MSISSQNKRILAIDIAGRGFGFVVMESPTCLIDWGVKESRIHTKARCTAQVSRLLSLYTPEAVIIQDVESDRYQRSQRVRKLIQLICELVDQRGLPIQSISWSEVQKAFNQSSLITKYQIAVSITDRLPELAPRLPRVRKPWMSEDYRMSIFDAVAFALTYYQNYTQPHP